MPVDGGLILGSIANEAFVTIESDIRRSDSITLFVRNDFDASTTSETTTCETTTCESACGSHKCKGKHAMRQRPGTCQRQGAGTLARCERKRCG